MSPQLKRAIDQTKTFLSELNQRQKVLLAVIGVAVLAGLWLFAHLLGGAEYVTLFSGLAPVEAQEIARKLSQRGVPFELAKDGTGVNVAASRVDRVRMDLASEGLPRTGRQGFEIFDKPNWMGSDFVEKVNYQRALEGELERTIQTSDEVEAVRVHIVLPHESLFTEQERGAKASVVLKLRGGRLSEAKLEGIRNLLSNAVDNLRPDDVTVIDADSQSPLLTGGSRGNAPKEVTEMERALGEKLIASLTPIVGAGKAKASVSVEYALETSDTVLETYDPNAVAVVSQQTSQQRSDNQTDQGIPGTASNVPQSATQPPSSGAAERQSGLTQSSENKTFAISKTVRHTVEPAGKIKRITAAVLVDDAVESREENGQEAAVRTKRSPEVMKQIQDIAEATIGLNTTRGDRVVVQNLSFLSIPVEKPRPATLSERVLNGVRNWFFAIRYAGLLLIAVVVYLSLLRPIQKQLLATWSSPQPAIAAGAGTPFLTERAGNETTAAGVPGAQSETELDHDLGREIDREMDRELAETNSEVKRTVILKRRLVGDVKKEPAAASRLVQSWIHQGESSS